MNESFISIADAVIYTSILVKSNLSYYISQVAFNFIDYTFVNELEMEYNGNRTLIRYIVKSRKKCLMMSHQWQP